MLFSHWLDEASNYKACCGWVWCGNACCGWIVWMMVDSFSNLLYWNWCCWLCVILNGLDIMAEYDMEKHVVSLHVILVCLWIWVDWNACSGHIEWSLLELILYLSIFDVVCVFSKPCGIGFCWIKALLLYAFMSWIMCT